MSEALYVLRCMQVLELLAFQPLSAPQVASTLGIHPRTARRILVRLHQEGYLTRTDDTRRRYSPTMRLVALAAQALARSPLAGRARRVVEQLNEETGADAHLVIPSYLSGLCIVHAENGRGAHVRSHELVPPHAAATGKVLLAFRQAWRDSVLSHPLERVTDHTIVAPHLLAQETDRIRRVGFATECDEAMVGVEGAAAPVFIGVEAVAALGASGPDADQSAVARTIQLARDLTETLNDDWPNDQLKLTATI
jgi:DNA-binding IclR family transcriptional regulator